jgi:CRP/FNR family transcriptional regulator, dissimilatory nitrate respiration regulator
MIDPSLLQRVPLLTGLAPKALNELARRGVLRRFAADEVLWHAGAEPRGLFMVVEGEARVVRELAGRSHVLHVEKAGGTLGEVPFFAGGRYPATVIATCPTTCLVLSRDALGAAMRDDPQLAFVLLGRLAERVRGLIGRLDGMVRSTVDERLALVLRARSEAAGGGAFTLGGTQAQLAEELGTTREVLARGLRRLRDAGRLRSAGRGCFQVVDPT